MIRFLPTPDPLQSAAFDVFSGVQDITIMGMLFTVGVVLVMTGVWGAMKMAGKRLKTAGIVEEKIVVHYIQTGEVRNGRANPPPNKKQSMNFHRSTIKYIGYCIVREAVYAYQLAFSDIESMGGPSLYYSRLYITYYVLGCSR